MASAASREFVVPSKPDVERLVLGAILVSAGRLMESAREVVERDTFTSEPHRVLWDAMVSLYARGQQIDRITVYHAVEATNPKSWSLTELMALDDELPDMPAIGSYLQILADCATRRKAIFALSSLAHTIAAGDATATALQDAEQIARRFAALTERKRQLQDVAAVVDDAGGLDRLLNPHSFRPATPMPWQPMCDVFEGLAPGKLTVLAARPGDGKTTAALQVAHHAASLGRRAVVFSLEMAASELLVRLGCLLAGVNNQKLVRGYCSESEQRQVAAALTSLASMPLLFDDLRTATVAGVRRAVIEHAEPIDLVVIDYLQLMSAGGGKVRERYLELGAITRDLKLLAREREVHVLGLCQLTRANEKEKRPPELFDLRESGSIEQDADNVLMLHHLRAAHDRGGDHLVKVFVRKQRTGPVGEGTLEWDSRVARFRERQHSAATSYYEPAEREVEEVEI
jgi:replicative DNA helicase